MSFLLPALAFLGGMAAGPLLSPIFEPASRELSYWLNKLWPNMELSTSDLVELRIRGFISEEQYYERMAKLGISRERADELLKLAKSRLTPEQATWLYFFGALSEAEWREIMRSHGYDDETMELYKTYQMEWPSISDIIRFAVREVFDEDVVRKYGYDEDLPQKYIEWAKRLGMPEEVAKWYWRAHWEIPSISQVIELYQRGIIDVEDVLTVLRIQDVAPYWRPRLLALAHDPYTRVDVRRMYELGAVTEEELVKAYRALGYATEEDIQRLKQLIGDPKVAERLFVGRVEALIKWTVLEAVDDARGEARRAIRDTYINGLIDAEQAKKWLRALHYPDPIIEAYITMWDIARYIDELKDYVNTLYEELKKGIITEEEFRQKLLDAGVAARVIEYYVAKARKAKKATVSE